MKTSVEPYNTLKEECLINYMKVKLEFQNMETQLNLQKLRIREYRNYFKYNIEVSRC